MKLRICVECYEGMHDTDFKMFVLKNVYRNMVANRIKRKTCYCRVPSKFVRLVAEKLENVKLARLFVEAQFHAMPLEFCIKTFNRKYPPVSTCFSGRCWERYATYLERGVKDAT